MRLGYHGFACTVRVRYADVAFPYASSVERHFLPHTLPTATLSAPSLPFPAGKSLAWPPPPPSRLPPPAAAGGLPLRALLAYVRTLSAYRTKLRTGGGDARGGGGGGGDPLPALEAALRAALASGPRAAAAPATLGGGRRGAPAADRGTGAAGGAVVDGDVAVAVEFPYFVVTAVKPRAAKPRA